MKSLLWASAHKIFVCFVDVDPENIVVIYEIETRGFLFTSSKNKGKRKKKETKDTKSMSPPSDERFKHLMTSFFNRRTGESP